jgi:hypothetical protein
MFPRAGSSLTNMNVYNVLGIPGSWLDARIELATGKGDTYRDESYGHPAPTVRQPGRDPPPKREWVIESTTRPRSNGFDRLRTVFFFAWVVAKIAHPRRSLM